MKWDQIETKWAAMTQRIRADYAADRLESTDGPVRGLPGRGAISATIANSRTATDKDAEFKNTAK